MEWMRNRNRNEEIRKLRKDGFSINRISTILKVSKSTVSLHCKGVIPDVTRKQEQLQQAKRYSKQVLTKACQTNRLIWDQRKTVIRDQAIKEWVSIRQNPTMMGFLGLYWGEGTKTNDAISIVNNDPGIIVASISCFKKLCPEAKLDIFVRVYPDHNKEEAERFWVTILRTKVRILEKTWAGKLHRAYSRRGICTVRFSDWKTRIKIMTWIDLWRKELIKTIDLSSKDFHTPV